MRRAIAIPGTRSGTSNSLDEDSFRVLRVKREMPITIGHVSAPADARPRGSLQGTEWSSLSEEYLESHDHIGEQVGASAKTCLYLVGIVLAMAAMGGMFS